MKHRFLKRLAAAGAIATSAAMLLGVGVGNAASLHQYPQFFTLGVNQFRATGSETTYYVMNAVGNLYSQSSVFGCRLNPADSRTCQTLADGSATDTLDDYSRNEFINGEAVGTGTGVGQLCGGATGGLTVDFARGSRAPKSTECSGTAQGLEFARDSVVGVTFPFHNLSTIACTTGSCTATQIGPVAAGWRPGDPLAGPYSGVSVSNLDNTASSLLGGRSVVYETYCDTSRTGVAIDDWGQLNDRTIDSSTGRTKGSEGIGTPIGVSIYFPLVNLKSGTYGVWLVFVGCRPNTKNTDRQVVQENDAPQLSDVAAFNNPSDNIAAANQVARSLYYLSYGVSQWHPYTYSSGGTGGKLTKINGLSASPAVEVAKTIATYRGLYNIYLPRTVRASVAGFLNYVCDTDPRKANHGIDLTTGRNYSDELTNTISTQFVFPRVPCLVDGSGNSIPPILSVLLAFSRS